MEKRSSSRLIRVGIILLLAVALVVGVVLWLGIPNGLHVSALVRDAFSREDFDCRVEVSLTTQTEEQTYTADLFGRSRGSMRVHGCSVDAMTLFLARNRLIFDNGRAYDLGDKVPQAPELLKTVTGALLFAGLEKVPGPEETAYLLDIRPEQLDAISGQSVHTGPVHAEFLERSGMLSEIRLTLRIDGQPAKLSLRFLPLQDRTVSDEVWIAASEDQEVLSIRVLEPLGKALADLALNRPMGADLRVTADCGPLSLRDTLKLYGTDDGLFLQRKNTVKPLEALDLTPESMIGIGYQFFRDSLITQMDDAGSYTLVIPPESVAQLCVEMIPEIESLPITYGSCSLLLEVRENLLDRLELNCSGEMPFLFTTIPIALEIELDPQPASEVILPQELL